MAPAKLGVMAAAAGISKSDLEELGALQQSHCVKDNFTLVGEQPCTSKMLNVLVAGMASVGSSMRARSFWVL